MEISDSLPLQWWPTGTESFGQESAGYIDDTCWNQIFLCSDLIRDQVNESAVFAPFTLDVEKNGTVIGTLEYINQSSVLLNNDMSAFVADDWLQDSLGGFFANNAWSQAAGKIQAAITYHPSDIDNTKIVYKQGAIIAGKFYDINIRWGLAVSGIGGNTYNLLFYTIKDGFVVEQIQIKQRVGTVPSSFAEDVNYLFEPTLDADYVGFSVQLSTAIENETTAYIEDVSINERSSNNNISFYASDFGGCDSELVFRTRNNNGDEIRYTDPIKFISAWENTPYSGSVLIQYNSVQNFDNIFYPITGYFSIRLDARFFHARIKGSQKSLELSTSSVATSSTQSRQKLLTVDAMPDYMHTKLQSILAHSVSGEVLIKGKLWIIEESYERAELNEFNPLKIGNVYLTEKNNLTRNMI